MLCYTFGCDGVHGSQPLTSAARLHGRNMHVSVRAGRGEGKALAAHAAVLGHGSESVLRRGELRKSHASGPPVVPHDDVDPVRHIHSSVTPGELPCRLQPQVHALLRIVLQVLRALCSGLVLPATMRTVRPAHAQNPVDL